MERYIANGWGNRWETFGSMFNMEHVKTTFAVYSEEEGYMAYLRVDEMVTWLAELKVESSTELLTHLYARSGNGEDVPISWEQLLYILSAHTVPRMRL